MKRTGSLLCKCIIGALAVLFVLALFLLRKRLSVIFIPLILSVLLAYMLDPAVLFVQKRMRFLHCKKRSRAVAVVFFSFLVIFICCIIFLAPAIISNIADIMENIDEIPSKLYSYIYSVISDEHAELREKAIEAVDKFAGRIKTAMTGISESAASLSAFSKIGEIAVCIITSLVFTFYLLKDKTSIMNAFLGLFPYKHRTYITETACELGSISSKFIQGQILVAIIIAVIEAAGLALLRVPYAMFFGLIGGIANMIPYFGPFFGAVLPIFAALMISPGKALWVLVLFVAVQQLDNHFISPKIIEGSLGIHPITVIILIFIGQEFFGLWGIVTIIPAYAMLRCLIVRILKFRPG